MRLIKPLLLPLALLLGAHALAFAWRAIPPSSSLRDSNSQWQSLHTQPTPPDVRQLLLAGAHWGEPQHIESTEDDATATSESPEATLTALSQHIQRQLQGIIRRGDWVLLFANPQGQGSGKTAAKDHENSPALPLELRSGDSLPDTAWQIGDIWPDRIQLLQDGHEPLIVPLYPLAVSDPES